MFCIRVAFFLAVTTVLLPASLLADEAVFPGKARFTAKDSLNSREEPSTDARACLDGLCWDAGAFDVEIEKSSPGRGDVLVRFPSPVDSVDDRNNRVAMEWYVARDEDRLPLTAPAVVVVHESGSGMTAGRFIAQGLCRRGAHTFLLHLPFYGERRTGRRRPDDVDLTMVIRQAIADVRRARDAVAVLPRVDQRHIALQGTSLGGFVCATTAGLDDGYDSVFILLAGGDLYNLIQTGKKDTAKVRAELTKAGLTDERLRSLTQVIEPLRIAHRLNPKSTWLYSGSFDSVVPIQHATVLAEAAGLDNVHHIRMPVNHYTGVVFLPLVMDHIHGKIQQLHARRLDSRR